MLTQTEVAPHSKAALDGDELKELLELIEFDWPEALVVIGDVYRYFSNAIEVSSELLVGSIVEDALVSYRTVTLGVNRKQSDDLRLAVFIQGLLDAICERMSVLIVADDGSTWSLESQETFSDWVSDHDSEFHSFHHQIQDVATVRRQLYEKLIGDNIKDMMKRVGYEAAIIAGDLGPGDRAAADTGVCSR